MSTQRSVITTLILLVGGTFIVKLFFLQIVDDTFKEAAQDNLIEKVSEEAYRGRIYDRNRQLLVYNRPAYEILVIPKEIKQLDTLAFSKVFGITVEVCKQKLLQAKQYSLNKPSVIVGPLYEEEFAAIQGAMIRFQGFRVRARTTRGYRYPYLAHVLGYVAEISKEGLETDTTQYYQLGDYKGVSGLEAYYESYLRGDKGLRYKMVNVNGREIGALAEGKYDQLSKPGQNLELGIDISLQAYAEKLMEDKYGSIVAIDPQTGEILSFVSAPNYPPTALSGRHFTKNFERLSKDTLKPLFNRPLMAMYRPGSIFKIAQALVALEAQAIDPETAFACDQTIINCHQHSTQKDLAYAIKNSCNPYFFRVMKAVIEPEGVSQPNKRSREGLIYWHKQMKKFGFGTQFSIDAPFASKGFVPDISYYDKYYGPLRWRYSHIYSLSIGEGENLVVPLQMANFAAILANGGYYYTPHFVRNIGQSQGPLPQYRKRHVLDIHPTHFSFIKKAMQLVVEGGTGWRARIPDITVCGKTGSVENLNREDHSVFIGFAPAEDPKIALAVYVEYVGEGGQMAAPIAGLLIEKYLKKEKAKLRMENYVLNFRNISSNNE